MAANTMNFTVDIEDYLAFNHQASRAKLLALSLSNPSKYESIRADIVKKLRNEAVKQVYTSLMAFLTTGKAKPTDAAPINLDVVPAIPSQEASKFCLSAADTLNGIFIEAVNLAMPELYSNVALKRDADLSVGSTPTA